MKERVESLNLKVHRLQEDNERVNKRAETAVKQLNQELSSARNNLARSTEQLQQAQSAVEELKLQVEQLAKSNNFYRSAMSQESSRHAMSEVKAQLARRAHEVLQATKTLKEMVAIAKRELKDDFFQVKVQKNIEIFKMKMSEEIQTKKFLEQSVARYKKELAFATKTAESSALVIPMSTTPRAIGGLTDLGTGEFKALSNKPYAASNSSTIPATPSTTSITALNSTPTVATLPNTPTPLSDLAQPNSTSTFKIHVQPFVPSFLSSRNKENLSTNLNTLSNIHSSSYTNNNSTFTAATTTPVKRTDATGSKEHDKTVGKNKPDIDDKLDLRAIELETHEISKRIERLKGGMGTSSLQQQTSSDGFIVSQRSFLDSSKGGAGTNRFFYEDSATK